VIRFSAPEGLQENPRYTDAVEALESLD